MLYPTGKKSNHYTIPSFVEKIDYCAFYGLNKIKNYDVDIDNQYFTSIDGVLFSKDKSKLEFYPVGRTENEYTIPSTVIQIGNRAFSFCSLQCLYAPSHLKEQIENLYKTAISNVVYY